MKKAILSLCLLIICSFSVFAQHEIYGRVVEIVDGRTVVIEVSTGSKITAQLQFIEVPEPEQQFSQTVRDHLEQIALGRQVAYLPHSLLRSKTVGQLFVNGVDVSLQMIRDGAAWYAAAEKTGQNAAESEAYRQTETQAKTEKLGIWSIEDLKPSWQIRAERAALLARQEQSAQKEADEKAQKQFAANAVKPQKSVARPQFSSESQILAMTAAANPNVKLPVNLKVVGGLLMGYDPAIKLGLIATPLISKQIPDDGGKQLIALQAIYMYYDANADKGRQSVYLIGIDSSSKDFKYLKDNDLTVTADDRKFVIHKVKLVTKRGENGVAESLVYRIEKSVFAKIANARNVSIKIGAFSSGLDGEYQMTLHNLLQASE